MIEGFLAGRNALVTGGAKRLGRAAALALAAEGACVVVHYRASGEEAAGLVDEINAMGARAYALAAELSDTTQTESLFRRACELTGPMDVLVNNASIFHESGLVDFSREALDGNIRVNAYAPLVLARKLAAQDRPGHIINFLDCRAVDYDRRHVAYHLSKRMLMDLTRMMALEFAPAVQVNAVAPGLILPPEGRDESYLAALADTNPMKRYGCERDVTDTVLFLLKSTFITGQVVFVDGGRHIRGCMYG